MTLTTEVSPVGVLPNGSWDNIPTAQPETFPEPNLKPTPEEKPDTPPRTPPGTCRVCGEPIVREPGARGRMPVKHPDCVAEKTPRIAGGTRRGSGKAEAEAAEAVAMLKSHILKGVMLLAAVDQFDAFCILASLPSACDNLQIVLVRHDNLRKEFLALKTGGSWFGLALSVGMMVAPILAHHGLIPSKRMSELLVNLPVVLVKLAQRMKDGEAQLTKLMADQVEAMNAAKANRGTNSET